jgi:hypothetical protein
MKPAEDMKKTIRNWNETTSARMDKQVLADISRALEQSQAQAAPARPHLRRTVMRSPLTKLTAAAVAIIAIGIGFVGILPHGGQTAYAFEETVEAMQGKRSFHIQTFFQQRRKDEFWAEFDENGEVVRYRQEEEEGFYGPVVTLWEGGVRMRYYPKPTGIARVNRIGNTEGELEEFDPETAVREIYDRVAEGKARTKIQEPSPSADLMTIRVTYADNSLRQVLLVDPETKFLVRVDNWYWDANEEVGYHKGIDVLEYNETIDPELFRPNFPKDTITLDQFSQEVGLAQGDMTEEEIASTIVGEALEAWAAGDYAKAGQLFGGAPPELLTERYADLHPVRILSIGQPAPVQYSKPWFKVPCNYEAVAGDQTKAIELTLHALAVDGQPGRWYVSIEGKSP